MSTPKVPRKKEGDSKKGKPTAGKKPGKTEIPDFSAPDKKKTADPKYRPMVSRGLPEPAAEGDVIEFAHPQHGRKTRGRVTAVGQDGLKARVADGSALDVPHGHVKAVLPTHDYGTETGVSPQDAKDAFLGPTKEGGMPATPMQIAILDVLAQFGCPLDDETITTVNYDQARRLITEFVLDDQSGYEAPDAPTDGAEPAEESEDAPGPSGGPTEGAEDEDQGENDPRIVEAVKNLVAALDMTSQATGEEPKGNKGKKKRE